MSHLFLINASNTGKLDITVYLCAHYKIVRHSKTITFGIYRTARYDIDGKGIKIEVDYTKLGRLNITATSSRKCLSDFSKRKNVRK